MLDSICISVAGEMVKRTVSGRRPVVGLVSTAVIIAQASVGTHTVYALGSLKIFEINVVQIQVDVAMTGDYCSH